MSFTREINILNIVGLVFISVMSIFLSIFFMNRSADRDIENIRQMLTEERMTQLRDQVANAFSVAETANFYEDAKKSISEMRFGDKRQNSFYVVDGDGMFFVNATSPETIGKIKLDIRDSDGNEYVREIIKTAKEKDEGYIRFREIREGSVEPVSRMAYFRYFKSWNWVIYAGMNINDIDEKLSAIEDRISHDLHRQILVMLFLSMIVLASVIYMNTRLVAARIIEPIKALTSAAEDMSLGNFDRLVKIESNSEIRSLADSIERLRVSLSVAMKKLKDRSRQESDLAEFHPHII